MAIKMFPVFIAIDDGPPTRWSDSFNLTDEEYKKKFYDPMIAGIKEVMAGWDGEKEFRTDLLVKHLLENDLLPTEMISPILCVGVAQTVTAIIEGRA